MKERIFKNCIDGLLAFLFLLLVTPSVEAQGDYPLAWTQSIGRGRSYYNALGHFDSTWRDARFQAMALNAIRWAANRN